MRLMHTALPDFIAKMKDAAKKNVPGKNISIKGLENLQSAKMQSLRTGRIEKAVEELALRDDIDGVEMIVMPRVPETMHTVVIKGVGKDGKAQKAIVDVINILHPTEEAVLSDCTEIEDRRPPIGRH
ncbi:MAG: hypothetical protein FWE20_05540 [Defluviitaleaceae bacterium]|nr:hypothetical protein [Defluviitaleaceae bacterium]